MNCRDVERWLDEGCPASTQVEAHAHARICARCQASLLTVDEIEGLLEGPGVQAPAGFASRVMARVAETRQAGARIPVFELLPFFQTVPWWVRLAVEPASLLAVLLASMLIWQGDRLFALATGGAVQVAAWLSQTIPTGSAPPAAPAAADTVWLQPAALTCIALGAIPLALMGSRLLYRWSASLVGPRHAR